ncbi:MAG: sigma-54-dependent transcriptional regulator, partial [Fidelibacterota bacterium]
LKYIAITGYSSEEAILELVNIGADRFLNKPYRNIEIIHAIKQLLRIQDIENQNIKFKTLPVNLHKDFSSNITNIIGTSDSLKQNIIKAEKSAKFQINTLISGPTGTGKELIAKYIHENSPRKNNKMVSVNCAELSTNLFESELFGYREGAFTGAVENKTGLFELADNGILFLDEITEIPIHLQAKLLRVIETQKIRKIAESSWKKVDVQILASTNRQIEQAIKEQKLRQDLYFRLCPMHIKLLPLYERREDIPLLLNHYLNSFKKLHKTDVKKISKDEMDYLKSLEWPGNVRQIKNFIQNYALFAGKISVHQLVKSNEEKKLDTKICGNKFDFKNGTFEEIEQAKSWLIDKALTKYDGNKTKAAQHLGMTYQGLLKYLKRNNKQ